MSDKDDETQRRARERAIAQAEREAQARVSPVAERAAQSKSFWADEEETACWAELNARRKH